VDRRRLVFLGALALIALHTAADAFLAPERGTSAGDHLLGGGVTLAVLLAAALSYPHLRVGARSCIAIVLGALAIEGAMLAIADAGAVGARGDDWTGFLLLPAGVALCTLGSLELWRSRRQSGRPYARRALLAIAAVVGAFWIVVPLAVALLATHRPRAAVERVDLGRPYRDVTLRTSDGLALAAWYVPSRNGAAVISFPTRKGKPAQARMLARHGYGVLVVDMRGYDGSEGDPNAFGWGATKDIDAAVAWLQSRPEVDAGRIGGIGFSVGGEQMLDAAAENSGLRAVVSEGAGERSVRERTLRGWRALFSLPEAAAQTAALATLSGDAPPPSLDQVVARIAPRSIFLVYAAHGAGGEDLNAAYFRAAHAPKHLWKVPDASHVGGYDAHPREYERRVVAFFDRALAAS
jgi:dienelactone hydrolase